MLEQAEEKLSKLWEALCSMCLTETAAEVEPAVDSQAEAIPSSSEDIPSIFRRAARELSSNDRDSPQVRSPLLETAAAVFSSIGLTRQVDASTKNALIDQMVELGLQRDWCEVSLRRCRYNVELALNMCFEHGEDMNRIVAEDAALLQSQRDRLPATLSRQTSEDTATQTSLMIYDDIEYENIFMSSLSLIIRFSIRNFVSQ